MDEAAIKAMSFPDRANAFAKEYEGIAKKYGVDIGCRLFAQDIWAVPQGVPVPPSNPSEVKPTEDNIPAKVDEAVK